MSTTTASLSLPKILTVTVFSRTAAWICSLTVSICLLLAPALWNGFAIVFYDTGGYIDRVVSMSLAPGRSFFYGLFLWLASLGWRSFWVPVAIQALAAVWLIRLTLRNHALASGPITTAAFAAVLSLSTGISWYTAQLMPDILIPLTVLALWLLALRRHILSGTEKVLLVAIALFGMLSHMSCLALGMGLAVAALMASLAGRRWRFPLPVRPLPIVSTVLAATLLMPLVHLTLFDKFGYTPGGPVFIFGRLVQDGIAKRYLAEHCPIEGVRLCAMQQRLPKTADEFLWGNSPFKEIGDWEGAKDELGFLVRECVKAYPGEVILSSLVLTAQQLVSVETGDGLDDFHEHARGVFARLGQPVAGEYLAARQQQDKITQPLFDNLNRVHVPVAFLSMFGLVLVIFWGIWRKQGDLAGLAVFVLVSLLGNAFICGALSNPHDRYQSRLVWVATLVVLMAMLRLGQLTREERSPGGSCR